jgi:hypothetical protein
MFTSDGVTYSVILGVWLGGNMVFVMAVIHFKTILSDHYQTFDFNKDMPFHTISGNVAV